MQAETSQEKTKLVMGYFGKEKPITRAEFVKRWRDQALELAYLANSEADRAEMETVVATTERLAGQKWDRIPDPAPSLNPVNP